jgi:hypothetical protein
MKTVHNKRLIIFHIGKPHLWYRETESEKDSRCRDVCILRYSIFFIYSNIMH